MTIGYDKSSNLPLLRFYVEKLEELLAIKLLMPMALEAHAKSFCSLITSNLRFNRLYMDFKHVEDSCCFSFS